MGPLVNALLFFCVCEGVRLTEASGKCHRESSPNRLQRYFYFGSCRRSINLWGTAGLLRALEFIQPPRDSGSNLTKVSTQILARDAPLFEEIFGQWCWRVGRPECVPLEAMS
jgi:hypothetical protein